MTTHSETDRRHVAEPDAVTLLRSARPDADPFDPDAPAARAALERILAAPPEARRPLASPRRRFRPRLVLAAGAAAAACAAVALVASPAGSPDVVARAAAAVGDPATILHYTAEVRFARDDPDRLPAAADEVLEGWESAGGRRARVIDNRANEIVRDDDAGTFEVYISRVDRIIRLPRVTDDDLAVRWLAPGKPLAGASLGDLRGLLERARDGDADVRLAGEATVRGREVYELSFVDRVRLVDRIVETPAAVYVDRETFLPVRVESRTPDGRALGVVDFTAVERVPAAEARDELEMSPHPGAEVDEHGARDPR